MAADEYRRNAIECLRIADETITARSRVFLIHMAEGVAATGTSSRKEPRLYETPPPRSERPMLQQQQQQQVQPKREGAG